MVYASVLSVYFQCTYGVLDIDESSYHLLSGYTAGSPEVHSKYTTQQTRPSFLKKGLCNNTVL